MEVHTFNSQLPTRFNSSRYNVSFLLNNGTTESVILNSTDRIASEITSISLDSLDSTPFIDKTDLTPINAEPDILIGMAEFWRFFVRIETLDNGLYVVHTLVGPIICGQDHENSLNGIKPIQSTLSVSSNY